MRIALKADVDTLRGTLEGVPALLDLYRRYGVQATFLFSLGPDHTGRALRRVFRRGFLGKVRRTSVARHYGFKTLLYGIMLPGPDISRRAGAILRQTAAAGHEAGIHCYDHVRWQDFVKARGFEWTRQELERAADAFERVFGRRADVHGAAGWQINRHALELEERLGFRYASDTRGSQPFLPSMDGYDGGCPQLPTTLPTLDELLGRNGIGENNVAERIFEASRKNLPHGHVYTLHAELEGMKLLPVMEELLRRWRATGDEICSLGALASTLNPASLPRHRVRWAELEGRSGVLAVQGETG